MEDEEVELVGAIGYEQYQTVLFLLGSRKSSEENF